MLDADDVVAGIDVMHFAGHPAGHVGEEINPGLADILQRDIAAEKSYTDESFFRINGFFENSLSPGSFV